MSAKIRVGVLGARGRMGAEVVKAVSNSSDLELVAQLDLGDSLELLLSNKAEVVVDFTTPDSVMKNLEFLISNDIHAVVGTTGFDQARIDSLTAELSKHPKVGVLIAPNFAIGAVLMMEFAEKAARYFESAEIVEMHHKNKVDSPSGTALSLGAAVAKGRGVEFEKVACMSRVGTNAKRKKGEIGFAALRGGDVIGDHTVVFASEGERIEITHKATTRSVFASGALRAAIWGSGQKAGFYLMRDVLK